MAKIHNIIFTKSTRLRSLLKDTEVMGNSCLYSHEHTYNSGYGITYIAEKWAEKIGKN